ncbi:hypothetical protein BpHYR1_021906 [Brachionus plicatilis]|uniref:Uncharacterized protein n=1 Tax=Brachionus plicatilis TaxID=10195 RepID=A0A3M7PS97_BRAPC|nr:hypothetical protein BpHYR1_021906 [Brachionus plicatilis]
MILQLILTLVSAQDLFSSIKKVRREILKKLILSTFVNAIIVPTFFHRLVAFFAINIGILTVSFNFYSLSSFISSFIRFFYHVFRIDQGVVVRINLWIFLLNLWMHACVFQY